VSRWAADGGAVSRWGADGIALSERTHDLHEGAVSRWAADGIALSERTHDLHGRTGAVSRWGADGIALSERTHDLHEGAVSRWAADGIALSERTHDLHGRTGAVSRWAADGIALSERTHDLHEGAVSRWAADGIALSERTHDLHEGAVSRWGADGIALSERTHDLHGRTGAARRGLTRAARSFPRPPSAPLKWKVGTHLDRGWARWGAHPMQDVPAAVKAALTRASSVANTQRSVRKPSVKTRYRAVVLDDSAADSVGSEQAVGCRLVCASKGDRHALATTTCWPHVLGVVSDIHEDLLGDICASELPE
jgi:hypothetical protein